MDPSEYSALAKVEQDHWFYSGKRQAVRKWISRRQTPKPSDLLVDVGAGTGLFAKEAKQLWHCRVAAVDDHVESLDLASTVLDPHEVLALGDEGSLPLADQQAAVVTALDVIEHIEDDIAALREMMRICKPGGLLVVTVPANRRLWSEWDEVLHHKRRYSANCPQPLRQQAGGLWNAAT